MLLNSLHQLPFPPAVVGLDSEPQADAASVAFATQHMAAFAAQGEPTAAVAGYASAQKPRQLLMPWEATGLLTAQGTMQALLGRD